MIREDYLMRLIRQLVDAIARITGYRKQGDYDRAMANVGLAWEELGIPRELVTATDAATLAELLRDPAKQRIVAELLAEEAHVMHAKGDPLNAGVLRLHAIQLFAAARAQDPHAEDDATIAEFGRHLPPADLSDALSG